MLFRKLESNEEKELLIDFLKNKASSHRNAEDLDNFWQTTRMFQSINYSFVEKNIFVDDLKNVKVILSNFALKVKKVIEHYEVWIDDDLPLNYLSLIAENLMKICTDDISMDKIAIFRSMPLKLFISVKDQLSKFPIHIIWEVSVNSYLVDVEKDFEKTYNNNISIDNFGYCNVTTEYTERIIENWKYGYKEDSFWIERSIKNFPSLGIMDLKLNKMVGSIISTLNGTFGLLYIEKEYRRRELAEFLVCGFIEIVKKANMIMLIEISDDNVPSICLFQKLGFISVSKGVYLAFDKIGINSLQNGDF